MIYIYICIYLSLYIYIYIYILLDGVGLPHLNGFQTTLTPNP